MLNESRERAEEVALANVARVDGRARDKNIVAIERLRIETRRHHKLTQKDVFDVRGAHRHRHITPR